MIISDQKKFIFFHNAKAAGSTLHHALLPFQSERPEFDFHSSDPFVVEHTQQLIWRGHITAAQLQGYEFFPSIRDYFKFCFVRNPYDRTYSAYLQHKAGICGSRQLAQPLLCQQIKQGFNFYIQNYLARKHVENNVLYHTFIPQSLYAYPDGERFVDFIGYAERFDLDVRALSSELDLGEFSPESRNIRSAPRSSCDPHEMQLSDYKYLDMYDSNSIAVVNAIYADDFENFGFRKLRPQMFPQAINATT